LTVGAFYAMRRRYLLLAALAGLAAGLTRPNGFWLAVPLLWLATRGAEGRGGRGGRGGPAILAARAPLAGVAIFSAYLSVRVGAAYGLWIAINIFPPVAAHLFISLGRFTSVQFPLFFWLVLVVSRQRVAWLAAVFAVCQAILAVCFFLWRPVV